MAESELKDKKHPDYALETESDDPDSLNAITALVAEGEPDTDLISIGMLEILVWDAETNYLPSSLQITNMRLNCGPCHGRRQPSC